MKLESSKYLFSRSYGIGTFVFPGGEVSVNVKPLIDLDEPKEITLIAHLHNSEALMQLIMAVDAIRRIDSRPIAAHIPYFPYARQDRVCNEGEAFSLKVVAGLINGLNFSRVVITDPHSDVTPALINNVVVEDLTRTYCQAFNNRDDILVAPDAGAIKKIEKISKAFRMPFIRADKKRDIVTGNILETTVYSEKVDKNLVIVDDICDGGRTFVELAKVLRPLTDKKIKLVVTHGIFSAGFDVFNGLIDEVWVVNPFKPLPQSYCIKIGTTRFNKFI